STNKAIEIFDMTARTVIGACMQGTQCVVAYSAGPSVHDFAAFVTEPVKTPPTSGSAVTSSRISVNWVGVSLTSTDAVVGPGKPVTLTATAALAGQQSAYMVQIYDADNGERLTYCVRGSSCSVSLTSPTAASRSIIAIVAKPSPSLPAIDAQAQSDRLEATWLGATISATSLYQIGGSVNLSAATNADLTNTPWALGIVDPQGHLVGAPCKASTCSAQIALGPGPTPSFRAVIGEIPQPSRSSSKIARLVQNVSGPTGLVNIQAQSNLAQPIHLLWGVDSCKSFTDDPGAASGLYPAISGALGAPDFWGRYLTTTICPGLSATEVAAAHAKHLGILPIYNDYNCSNVSGYATGLGYAAAAVSAARSLGIPANHALAIDIEPPGDACPGAANVDTGFIQGWYDGITGAGYEPVYYGDATPGSAFATQWCYAVAALPYIGQKSYLWSFQPSLYGGYMKSNAPGFSPNLTGCLGFVHAWQYQIGSDSSTPDVDGDEATSELPLWFP
ncbi:MAG TPA: glycoside hydrolase domain-containing protein, partial [Candidatus Dormibacteraeota bacterium]|nr:glycoside hydrolase domain-containing protein [Candidatus Dormibacteraeota bacterium]